jgi:BASS family bile acid:Na+ symporter
MDKPVRIASMVILAVVIVGALIANRDLFFAHVGELAAITVLFCAISLTIGFLVPRLFRVERRQAVASSFEIGIHNATLAIVIAVTVLESEQMQLPGAVYGVLMFFVALLFGLLVARIGRARESVPR